MNITVLFFMACAADTGSIFDSAFRLLYQFLCCEVPLIRNASSMTAKVQVSAGKSLKQLHFSEIRYTMILRKMCSKAYGIAIPKKLYL